MRDDMEGMLFTCIPNIFSSYSIDRKVSFFNSAHTTGAYMHLLCLIRLSCVFFPHPLMPHTAVLHLQGTSRRFL